MFLFFIGWYTWFPCPNTSFQEKEEKLDGDAALNKFFCEIYQDANEDTRRAMSKSFVSFFFCFLSMIVIVQCQICWGTLKFFVPQNQDTKRG